MGRHPSASRGSRPTLPPLVDVITRELRAAPASGRRPRWLCPFHDDHDPSLTLTPDGEHFKCWSCGARGDAIDLIRRLIPSMSYAEALIYLAVGPFTSGRIPPGPAPCPGPRADVGPLGMAPEAASRLVAEAADRLWTPAGTPALTELTGPRRSLRPETIRAHRLGYAPRVEARRRDGSRYTARGIVIPWFDAGRLMRVNIRQPDGSRPKYCEVFDAGGPRPRLYPGREAIRVGRPLVIAEGEFEPLLLGQELGERAGAVTLGNADDCARPCASALVALLGTWPWLVATDADPAGDRAAAAWVTYPGVRRIRPPGPFKDWGEAKRSGVDLRRWWGEILAGVERPALFAWEELARLRWGSAAGEPTPGLVVDRPEVAGRAERFADRG